MAYAIKGGGGGEIRTLSAGRLSEGGATTLASAIDANMASGGDVQPFRDFASYANCTWRLSFNGVPQPDQVFSTAADLVAYINANATPGQNVTYILFDRVDGSIAPPPKIYAQNRTFAQITSQGSGTRYYGRTHNNASNHTSGGAGDNMFSRMWQTCFGSIPGAGFTSANARAMMWFPMNSRRYYDTPELNSFLTQGINGRRGWDGAASVAVAGDFVHYAGADQPWCYGAMNQAGSTGTAFDPDSFVVEQIDQLRNGWSHVVGIPIVQESTGLLAMYVKPVGVDHFYVETFDRTQYAMEVVGVDYQRGYARQQELSTPLFISGGFRHDGPWHVSEAADVNRLSKAYANMRGGEDRPGGFSIQYRDLQTGCVSELCNARIVGKRSRNLRPFHFRVENLER